MDQEGGDEVMDGRLHGVYGARGTTLRDMDARVQSSGWEGDVDWDEMLDSAYTNDKDNSRDNIHLDTARLGGHITSMPRAHEFVLSPRNLLPSKAAHPLTFDTALAGNARHALAATLLSEPSVDETHRGDSKAQSHKENNPSRFIKAFTCPHVDCHHIGTFRRQYELQRHLVSKHSEGTLYRCPVPGCFKGAERSAFARKDKLTSHLRSVHPSLPSYVCPQKNCEREIANRHVMHAHLRGHLASHEHTTGADPALQAVANAFSPAYVNCPWRACSKTLPLAGLQSHMLGHSQEELLAMRPQLWSMNYVLHLEGCSHVQPTLEQVHCACRVTAIHVRCPICGVLAATHHDFQRHLTFKHLIRDPDHLNTWLACLKERFETKQLAFPDEPPAIWDPWRIYDNDRSQILKGLACPACSVDDRPFDELQGLDQGLQFDLKHHLDMLCTCDDLRSHREEILALIPGFSSHPMFDDITGGRIVHYQRINVRGISWPPEKKRPMVSAAGPETSELSNLSDAREQRIANHLPGKRPLQPRPDEDVTALLGIGEQFSLLDNPYETTAGAMMPEVMFETPLPSHVRSDLDAVASVSAPPLLQQSASSQERTSASNDAIFSALIDWKESLEPSNTDLNVDTRGATKADRSDLTNPGEATECEDGRTIACEACGKEYATQSKLNKHKRCHIPYHARPHACPTCGMRFSFPKDLKRHYAKHREPQLSCPSCGKHFSREDQLWRHVRQSHG